MRDFPIKHLGPQAAFVIATIVPAYTWRGKTSYSWFLLGVVRADVTRLTVSTPGFFQTYYGRGWGAWGTFQASLGTQYPPGRAPGRPWRATVTIYGHHGVLARLPLRYARAGEFLLTPAA